MIIVRHRKTKELLGFFSMGTDLYRAIDEIAPPYEDGTEPLWEAAALGVGAGIVWPEGDTPKTNFAGMSGEDAHFFVDSSGAELNDIAFDEISGGLKWKTVTYRSRTFRAA